MNDKTQLVAATQAGAASLELQKFETALVDFIKNAGLPADRLLVAVPERAVVFQNIGTPLQALASDVRGESRYISKFLAAVAAGLFDAALNYLWNETVQELRKRVLQYDLTYFYDQALAGSETRRKNFTDESDILRLDDSELIHGARQIELISPVGYQHLEYIKYMRNWASAAHPNNNELTGLQLVSWLETCIKQVISLPLSNSAVEIGKLMRNVRSGPFTPEDAKQVGLFFAKLTKEQVTALANGFFGLYTRADTTPAARGNVNLLLPALWSMVDESVRHSFGIRHAKFAANNDRDAKEHARRFLDIVSGQAYLTEDVRAHEIDSAIANLLGAHRAWNNFYNEPPHAVALKNLVGDAPIPKAVDRRLVEAVLEAFLTNGNGTAHGAEPSYKEIIARWDERQVLNALLCVENDVISSRLQFSLARTKFLEFLAFIEPRLSMQPAKDLVAYMRTFSGPFNQLRIDAQFKNRAATLRQMWRP